VDNRVGTSQHGDRVPESIDRMGKLLTWRAPEACIVAWLGFLGLAVWRHVEPTQQPLVYDAITYYQKAFNFWRAFRSGGFFNPLNLDPAVRPPGTVLMSYPFGFDADPRGLFFRSIFFPAALFVLAALIVTYQASNGWSVRWRAALCAVFFSTPSIVYWFAVIPYHPTPSYWGCVDNFLSGVAALCAAAAWRSAKKRSLPWFVGTGVTSSLCILIKPSGALVAAVVGLMCALFCLAVYRDALPVERASTGRRLLSGLLLVGAIDTSVMVASLSSKYLSPQSMAWGEAAIAVVRAELHAPISALLAIAHQGPGYGFLLWTVLAVLIIACGSMRMSAKAARRPSVALPVAALIAAAIALAAGLWFWLDIGSGVIIRYGMPFFMMAAVWTTPPLLRQWQSAPRLLTACMTIVMLVATINLALLLVQRDPPAAWQNNTGVSLSAGSPFGPMPQFQHFVDAPRARPALVYSLQSDEADQVLTTLIYLQQMFHPDLPALGIARPNDWARPTTYHLDEMAASDYLLFHPQLDPAARETALDAVAVPSFAAEQAAFIAWATELTPADGVDVVIGTSEARIIRIRDRASFRAALLRLVSRHRWRPVFIDANPEAKPIEAGLR
jgi:hypothetical protein